MKRKLKFILLVVIGLPQTVLGQTEFETSEYPNLQFTILDSSAKTAEVCFKGTAPKHWELALPGTVVNPNDGQTYTVTEIANDAFAYTSRLEKITIPGTIVRIGEYAFTGTNLMSVDFSAATSLTELPKNCFSNCYGLAGDNVSLPASITTIGESCFNNCHLGSLTFLSGTALTTIGDNAFCYCELPSLSGLPATVENIGAEAFSYNQITEFAITPAMKVIGANAFDSNRISYIKLNPATEYDSQLAIYRNAFAGQKCELTVEFDEACTTVPDYIKACPFSQTMSYDDENFEDLPTCLRVIVPINSILAYRSHAHMGQVRPTDYRVKFKWGTFSNQAALDADAEKSFADRSYYGLYNITPNQRLIATSAWKNDILNFRPKRIGNARPPVSVQSKPTLPDAGTAGRQIFRSAVEGGLPLFYSNTVDYWNEATKKATPLPEEDDFFDANAFAFNNKTFEKTDEANYPKSLMPYTIHSYHANNGSEEVERLGRKPVEDGVVPFGTGIVIDFPKPGYYLVPPIFAQTPEDISKYVACYTLDSTEEDNPISDKRWEAIAVGNLDFWIDLRNPVVTDEPVPAESRLFIQKEDVSNEVDFIYLIDLFEDMSCATNEQKERLRELLSQYELLSVPSIDYGVEYELANNGYIVDEYWNETFYNHGWGRATKDGTSYMIRLKQVYSYVNKANTNEKYWVIEDEQYKNILIGAGVAVIDEAADEVTTLADNKTWERSKQVKYMIYHLYGSGLANLTRNELSSIDDTNKELKSWQELLDEGYLWGGLWYDIDDRLEDNGVLVGKFNENHNPESDHNVIIGLPDRYPIYPYWAASPYPWIDKAHDDQNHLDASERFNIVNEGDENDPLNFKYAQYGRMGNGYTAASAGNYGNFVSIREVQNGTKTLDSDIQYVNFGVSKGYFVQVKSEPGNASTKTNWTQPHRAYFSVSRAHMPHVFSDGEDAKIAMPLITDDMVVTRIEETLPNDNGKIKGGNWHTLDGRRLAGKPTTKGIYIHNGRKEVIR